MNKRIDSGSQRAAADALADIELELKGEIELELAADMARKEPFPLNGEDDDYGDDYYDHRSPTEYDWREYSETGRY